MDQNQFSEEFKKAAVQKVLLRRGKTVVEACEEIGISRPSFYEWRKNCVNAPGMKNKERSPQDWSAAEKFKAVMDYDRLTEEKRGEFLRREGLHSEHLKAWSKLMESGLDAKGSNANKAFKTELSQLKAENKELKNDLHHKDRALASVTALLVLKKKANLIWGTGEDE